MKIRIVPVEPEPELTEDYFEMLAATLGEEAAAWARLPRTEREKELAWYHEHFNTPDDLAIWPPELGGGKDEPWSTSDVGLQSTPL